MWEGGTCHHPGENGAKITVFTVLHRGGVFVYVCFTSCGSECARIQIQDEREPQINLCLSPFGNKPPTLPAARAITSQQKCPPWWDLWSLKPVGREKSVCSLEIWPFFFWFRQSLFGTWIPQWSQWYLKDEILLTKYDSLHPPQQAGVWLVCSLAFVFFDWPFFGRHFHLSASTLSLQYWYRCSNRIKSE